MRRFKLLVVQAILELVVGLVKFLTLDQLEMSCGRCGDELYPHEYAAHMMAHDRGDT
jgi:hypothetical protein